ncbi:MAG: propionyl-CoA carboxylase [Chloroflexi bacterium]|nr:propionyl-CoA carboxylase [Chloroflexota bacterium]
MTWEPEVEELQRRHALAEEMGGPEGIERQHRQGKLTIRERIALLVDPGSFDQMGTLQGRASYDADGRLTEFRPVSRVKGLAKVDGRRVIVSGQDFTIRGGSARTDDGGVDIGHGHPDATQLLLPTVNLLDGAGGSVTEFADLGRTYIPDGGQFEAICKILNLAPVATAVLGPAAGGLAPIPCLSHFSVIAKGTGQVFPGGPPVVKAALGLAIDKEELGGWRVHTRVSGVVDNVAEDEADAIAQVRRFLSYMPDNVWQAPPRTEPADDPGRRDERLLSLIPRDRRRPYDPRVLIEGVLDAGSFFEISPDYGTSRIVGLARANGYVVGVMANNPNRKGGSMDVDAAEKSTRLVQLCDTFHIPMVVLMDDPGFFVGPESEARGIERSGSRLVYAIMHSKMPWISVICRQSFGLAGSLQFRPGPDLFRRYAWVSGQWGSMHIEGGTSAAFRRIIESADDPEAKRQELEQQLQQLASPFRTAEATGLDLIDPRDTRAVVCEFVETAQGVIATQLGPGSGPTFRP